MSATAAAFTVTDEQLDSAGAPSYDAIEVPADYEARLKTVEDYDKREDGGSYGWIFTYEIEGLPFKIWLAHSTAARWKLIETVHAHRPGFFDVRDESGASSPVDPNEFIGDVVGAHVVLDDELDTPRKVIDYLFSLEQPEPSAEDVPVL